MTEIIRVLLADDHPAVRVGLCVLLDQAPDVKVVSEVGDGPEALAQIEAMEPEVAVLDCRLPGMAGAEVAAEIRRRGLPPRVLALSSYDDDRYMREMMDAGAVGYLLKDRAPREILAAVRAAWQGERLWTAEQLARIRRWREEVQERWERLTGREREVLLLMAAGRGNREITQELKITERTVEFHVSNVLAKLEVASRLEAVVWVKDHGLDDRSAR